jgi:hypothetical protein
MIFGSHLDALDKREISCPCLESSPGRPSRILSLHRTIPILFTYSLFHNYEVYSHVFVKTTFSRKYSQLRVIYAIFIFFWLDLQYKY